MGVFMIGAAVEGHLFTKINPLAHYRLRRRAWLDRQRHIYDLMGLAVLVLLVAIQHYLAKKEK